jgi:hypothetical protein
MLISRIFFFFSVSCFNLQHYFSLIHSWFELFRAILDGYVSSNHVSPSFACICGWFACQWHRTKDILNRTFAQHFRVDMSNRHRQTTEQFSLHCTGTLANEEETNKVSTVCSSVLSSMVCIRIHSPGGSLHHLQSGGSCSMFCPSVVSILFSLVPETDVLVLISLKVSNQCMC